MNSIAISVQTHILEPGRELPIATGGNVFEILSSTGDVEVKLGQGDFNRLPAGLVVGDPSVYFRDLVLRNISDAPNEIEIYVGTGQLRDNRFVAAGQVEVGGDAFNDVVAAIQASTQPAREFRPLPNVLTISTIDPVLLAPANPNRAQLMIKNISGREFIHGSGNFRASIHASDDIRGAPFDNINGTNFHWEIVAGEQITLDCSNAVYAGRLRDLSEAAGDAVLMVAETVFV